MYFNLDFTFFLKKARNSNEKDHKQEFDFYMFRMLKFLRVKPEMHMFFVLPKVKK